VSDLTVWTIGHSTRPLDLFLDLLQRHGVGCVADVRTVPRSRRHPQYAREALERSLPEAGLRYEHFAGLGGLRKPRRDSTNMGWRHPSFRGYADYMQTPPFTAALARLEALAMTVPTAIMCAEAVWWQCHRQLIADALVARGYQVRHILSADPAAPHALTSFARVEDGRVTYPGLPGLSHRE
jgi:uncharacterized protein (DUF488 family)